MGQCISAPKTTLRQPLRIGTGFSNEGDEAATSPQAALHPANGEGVPCFVRDGFGVGAQTSPRWEQHQRGGRRREFGVGRCRGSYL